MRTPYLVRIFVVLSSVVIVSANCAGKKNSSTTGSTTSGSSGGGGGGSTPAKTITVGVSTSQGYAVANSTTTSTTINTQATTNLVVFVTQQGIGAGTLTDNMGNTYTLAGSMTYMNALGSYQDETHAYYCLSCNGGTGHTFTYTKTNGYSSIFAIELQSTQALTYGQIVATSSPENGTNINSGNMTTTQAGSMLVGFAAPGEASGNVTYTWNNGFTKQLEITNMSYWQGTVGTLPVTPGTYSADVTSTQVVNGGGILLEFY